MSSDEDLSLADDSEDELLSNANDNVSQNDMDDLFGDDAGDGDRPAPKPTLDDEELDSGDDEGRADRLDSESQASEKADLVASATELPRHVVPDPSDNELYLMKVPPFLGIEPIAYKSRTFQPPANVHHSHPDAKPTPAFNAYSTALSTIRWRHSPSGPEEQSNARIIRWSDGSLTLQVATDPTTQYAINPKALAPPQTNPPIPTPTSYLAQQKRRSTVYDPKEESYTYVCAPLESAFFVRTLAKITTSLQVQVPNQDDSIESLKASMAAIVAKYGDDMEERQKGPKIEDFKGDPTQFEKEALKLDRELQKKQRKEDRDRERNIKFGRAARTGGLTIDALEDEAVGRPRASKAKGPRRVRRDEYSDEEDELYGRRGGPQDTYDMEDDFLVNSEEEGDEGGSEDAEGEDEDIDDIIERNERNQKRQSPKRSRDDDDTGNAHNSPLSRAKRRRVVSSDEEE